MPDQPHPRDLIGGYATSTLSREEREQLLAAALDDQQLFDELVNEEPLRELLDDPLARQKLIDKLSGEHRDRWFRFGTWRLFFSQRRYLAYGCLALLIFVGAIVVSLLRLAGPPDQSVKIELTSSPPPVGAPTGTYLISTNPAGVPVLIDSVRRGVTPLGVELPPGQYTVLITDRRPRRFQITIESGSEASQFFDLPAAAASPTTNGELQVRTDPPAAAVIVDGRSVGRSPVSVADLPPGPHTVQLASEGGTATERVRIEPGKTASLFVPLGSRAGAGSTPGWVTVEAPADVQVFEGDRFIGTDRIDRIMLPVGRHDLEIVNESLGYRERRSVQITAGQVSSVRLNWPNGTLAIYAVPWAEAFVDGMPVGETPIGGIQVPIGVHEIVLRHPDLGERRATVTVTLRAPAKVGVDLRSKLTP